MKTKSDLPKIAAWAMVLIPLILFANNLQISEVSLVEQNLEEDYIYINFAISWENSWKYSEGIANWDAVWLFAKYRIDEGEWQQCTLATDDAQHAVNTEAMFDASFEHDNNGVGGFIYRADPGTGNINWQDNRIRWNYGINQVPDDASMEVKLFGIEMVYVPEGHHNLNTVDLPNLDAEIFNDPQHSNSLIEITSEDAIPAGSIRWTDGFVWGGVGYNNGSSYGCAELGDTYPKGYAAFYCMKYELSQGQYAEFLNTITEAQCLSRQIHESNNYYNFRGTISGTWPQFTASRPDRACNFISYIDHLAYLDWSGLRPMTELEYNKACRGDQDVIANEYACGSNVFITNATTLSGAEDGTETILDDGANAAYYFDGYNGGDGGRGPLRCGIFATPGATTRQETGASYYGIMDLSGNVTEQCISIAGFRGFDSQPTYAGQYDGSQGDGVLSNEGNATNINWPGRLDAVGGGRRGGSVGGNNYGGQIDYRYSACAANATRNYEDGCRGVRSL
ncbi:MAG: formylglycine-generating enzyme family protein [Candidatus Cloacimonetes bacterium]|nr:formylglycine-generating enzyme family protein [Candidatus Cloacimonadota bacterium]